MARHRADIMAKLTVRVPRGQQGFWEIIRVLHTKKRRWTIDDVDGGSNVHRETVGDFIRRLVKGGYIREVGRLPRRGKAPGQMVYTLAKDQPEAPRLRRDGSPAKEIGRGQDQLWRSIKMLARFDARDLAIHATTEDARVTLLTARTYLRHLHHAGYLAVVTPGRPSGHKGETAGSVYRLLPGMNTGPLAPQIQRADFVWDPNRKKVMGAIHAAKGDAA